jgi:hypothetical protein
MEQVQKKDEVDLIELFLNLLITIRKNFWLIVLFFILGTAVGFAYYASAKKVYQSNMVISSGILTSSYSKALIENINRHRREQNFNVIKNLLRVSDSTARNLAFLEIEKLSQVDDLKEADKFMITAEVFDQNILRELQQGLVYYLENNEYVKIRVEQSKKYLDEMLAKVDDEIKDMESMKAKIINGSFFESAKGNVMFDPTTVNSKILDLTEKKLTLQNNRELVNSVQVIEGFSQFDRPARPSLSVSLVSGSVIGLFFVSCLIAFKSVRKLLRMADAVKQKA